MRCLLIIRAVLRDQISFLEQYLVHRSAFLREAPFDTFHQFVFRKCVSHRGFVTRFCKPEAPAGYRGSGFLRDDSFVRANSWISRCRALSTEIPVVKGDRVTPPTRFFELLVFQDDLFHADDRFRYM